MTKKLNSRGLIKDSSIYLFATFLSFAVGLITMPIYTRHLSPADYGIVALFVMFGQVSSGLLSLGLQSASYRYYFKYKNNIEVYRKLNFSIIILLLIIFVIGGLCIYLIADWLSYTLFDQKISAALLRLSFLSGCLEYFFVYFTFILTAQLRSITYSIIIILRVVIRTVITLYFIFMHSLTYLALVYSTLITQCVIVFSLIILTGNLIRIKFSTHHLKKSLNYSYPMVLRLGIGMLHKTFDKLMLTNYSGLSSVGYYSFGERFANLLKLAMDSIGKVWSPYFLSRAHENTKNAKKDIIRQYLEMSFFIMCAGLGIIYFSEEMIKLLTTKEYYPAMYITPIYVYYYLFGILGMLSISQIQFSEKTLYILPASIVSVTLNISLNIILIPQYGAVGAVIALSLSAFFSSMVHLYFGFKLFPLPMKWGKFAGIFFILILFTVPVYPIMMADITVLVKIAIKSLILLLVQVIGIKLNYTSMENINLIFRKIIPSPKFKFANIKNI